jgi:predicted glutamine amidotransferase
MVATRPLTRDESWSTIVKGTLAIFRDGEITARAAEPKKIGRRVAA